MARDQLGTVGSGNHYLDIFQDEDGFLWIGVHFGSRGLGHKTATMFLKLAGAKDGIDVEPTTLHQDSDLGRQCLAGMTLAGHCAQSGRAWVVERVRVHNHHNYAWREPHGQRDLWGVRKGATRACPGQRGFVGGSMGDNAVILSGIDSGSAVSAFYSTIHGAGRVMSRSQARGKRDRKTRKITLQGRVSHDEMRACARSTSSVAISTRPRRSIGRLPDVLSHHTDTIAVEHTLRLAIVVMAGQDVFDPSKDYRESPVPDPGIP